MSASQNPADLGSCEYQCTNGKWVRIVDGSIEGLSHCPVELGVCTRSGATMVVPALEGPGPTVESTDEKTE